MSAHLNKYAAKKKLTAKMLESILGVKPKSVANKYTAIGGLTGAGTGGASMGLYRGAEGLKAVKHSLKYMASPLSAKDKSFNMAMAEAAYGTASLPLTATLALAHAAKGGATGAGIGGLSGAALGRLLGKHVDKARLAKYNKRKKNLLTATGLTAGGIALKRKK